MQQRSRLSPGNLLVFAAVTLFASSLWGQDVSLSTTSLAFGNQVINTTSVQKLVTLTNTGTVALSITSVVASPSQFVVQNRCGASVAAGANCQLKISFTPPSTGAYTGTVTLTDNATNSPQTISLTGTGVLAVSLSPSSLTFPSRSVGTTSTATKVTLSNNQAGTLNISSIAITGDFAQTNTCGTSLVSKASCAINVTFTPTANNARNGTLTVSDDASSGSPQTTSLTGTGTLTGLSSIAVTPVNPSIVRGATQQFVATGTFTGGRTASLTTSVLWSSSVKSVATISNNAGIQGLATSLAGGSTTITAKVSTFTNSTTLTVNSAPLTSITLSPSTASLAAGQTQQFTATGHYSDGTTQDLTAAATWSATPTTVASVVAGLAKGLAQGTATITAASGTVNGSASMTVSAPVMTSLTVAPATASVDVAATVQFSATGNFSDGSTQNLTSSALWSSSDTTKATVESSGTSNPGQAAGIASGSVTITASASGMNGTAALSVGSGLQKIQHVVFIIKENRSFDSYFGTYPGADGATSGAIHTGAVIPLGHLPDRMPRDLDHSWTATNAAIDGGKMDGYDLSQNCTQNGDYLCYGQLYQSDIPNYWTYAQNFVLSDAFFSSLSGESFPNHLYTVGAQSGGAIDNPQSQIKKGQWGCDADSTTGVTILNPDGTTTKQFPCFNFSTLADSLNSAGISWRSYQPAPNESGYIWAAFRAINQIYNSPYWTSNVSSYSNFVADAQAGNLAAVNWLVMPGDQSEHPVSSSCVGENWTVQQINAIMQGPQWSSTAIFLTWDDYGGFYDHAVPSKLDQFGLGPRVPMLIISPYSIKGKISHTQYEFSSMLKFVEDRYGLPTLTQRDAQANDMSDSFDFSQTPLAPMILQTRTCP